MTEKIEKKEKEKAPKPKKEAVPAKKKPEAKEAVKEEKAAEHVEKRAEKKAEAAAPPAAEAPAGKPEKAAAAEEKAAPREPKAKKHAKKAKERSVVARGKRKKAVARAAIRPGKGVIRVNRVLLDALGNKYMREVIREPVRYVGPEANSVDISVNVFGGGAMGQAQAARTAIANALVKYFEGISLREKFISIDRSLVVEDTRRVESKKYRGPKARARYQKSYR